MSAVLPSSADLSGGIAPRLSLPWTLSSAFSTLALVLLPLAAPIILVASIGVLLLFGIRPRLLAKPPTAIAALLVAVGYLLINATWSLSPQDAFRAVGLLAAITAILYLTLGALETGDQTVIRSLAAGLVAGLAVAGLMLCIEAF